MVKPTVCPLKPKVACSKRLLQKRRTKTARSTNSNSSNGRLTSAEMQEMRRLAQILPTGMRSTNPQNDPLRLLQNATQYINHLTSTLVARAQNGSISQEVIANLPATIIESVQRRQPTIQKISKSAQSTSRRK
ncbi:hypothetical protein M3Y97_00703300 [Aphelenchoides bicaudatus]|nr:hypothetical protein M3Y97_00703300 [Aphelenchoides bicaudatus]